MNTVVRFIIVAVIITGSIAAVLFYTQALGCGFPGHNN